MCGKCCEAIHMSTNMTKIVELADNARRYGTPTSLKNLGGISDAEFIQENWTPITMEQAHEINPHLKTNYDESTTNGHKVYDDMSYYTCSQFNKETRLCMAHSTRPKICEDYPWYGRRPDITFRPYSPDCGYIIDVDEERALWNGEDI